MITFARFTSLALLLSTWARAHSLQAPQYRSPPRMLGVSRSLRRAPGCRPVVSVRLVGRDRAEVVRDMVDGLLAVNPVPGPTSERPPVPCLSELREAAIAYLLADGTTPAATPAAIHGAAAPGAATSSAERPRAERHADRIGPVRPLAA